MLVQLLHRYLGHWDREGGDDAQRDEGGGVVGDNSGAALVAVVEGGLVGSGRLDGLEGDALPVDKVQTDLVSCTAC